jgi:hypothetical protein
MLPVMGNLVRMVSPTYSMSLCEGPYSAFLPDLGYRWM